jgi:signal transduction histidine kinase
MNEEQRTMMLRGIVHDADRMDAIVRQLLDAARLVSGSFEWYPERTDVSELVLSIQEYYRVDPEHPALIWEGEPLSAFVDPARLSTIIMAFTESLVWWGREGAIRLSARLEEDCLVIEAVRDGSELPADSVEDLFTPRRPGSGAGSKIGLFVAREVARSRGGDAYGTVERDRLTFRLRLPVAGQAPAPPLG